MSVIRTASMKRVALTLASTLALGCGGLVEDERAESESLPTPPAAPRLTTRNDGWHDSRLGVDCSFRRADDGVIRCLPAQASLGIIFSDPGCTVHVSWTDIGQPAPRYANEFFASPDRYRVYQAGAPHAGPLYMGRPGLCTDETKRLVYYTFYARGSEVPPEAFVGRDP